jgi:hypothetical protein
MQFFDGAKTYIVALLVIGIGLMHKLDWIDSDTRNVAITVLMGSGLTTLRMSVAKIMRKMN